MTQGAKHAALLIHTRRTGGSRARNGCPHSPMRRTARHMQPCVATPHAAPSAQLSSRWSRTALSCRIRSARKASCHARRQHTVRMQWNQRGRSSNGGRLTNVAVMSSDGSSFRFLRSGHDRQAQRRPLGCVRRVHGEVGGMGATVAGCDLRHLGTYHTCQQAREQTSP